MIRLGTRGSALALAQATWVADRLPEETELITVRAAGDRGAELSDKSQWVSELEQALLDGEIDMAVHSAKDVPAELAEGLALVAVPEREDPRDVICGAESLDAVPPGARVGTSSLRRAAQLRALRDDLEIVPIRGNVDTRLRKLADGEVDALVLAAAGLARLGRSVQAGGALEELVPAAGQGALALEARPGALARELLAAVDDRGTGVCLAAERELVRRLGASCNTPVGAHARATGEGRLELVAWLGLPDGAQWISDRVIGPADDVAAAVAQRLLSMGAAELLAQAAREVEA